MLDLHGYTIHTGWKEFKEYIDQAYLDKKKSVTIITGKGAMHREFNNWCSCNPKIRDCDEYKTGGSWRVRLIK